MQPVIILIRPQMGENIGAVARAMSNFGLEELRIVAPRDGWPNRKASEMASRGKDIIDNAKVFADFAGAMADIHFAYATTARPRDMSKPVLSPQEAMKAIISRFQHSSIPDSQPKSALVFGPERTGIENEELALCDGIITIPTSSKNPSLNLGQSAVIIGYEWYKASLESGKLESGILESGKMDVEEEFIKNSGFQISRFQHSSIPDSRIQTPAPRQDLQGLFEQLEGYLDSSDYFRVPQKKPVMWQNLRSMLLRGAWNEQEIRTFRGMLRNLWEHK